jgi:RimJ/RimL family protein N-acetyltransferase
MLKWRFLTPEQLSATYEHVKDFLPDNLRNPTVFAQLFIQKDTLFFEVGDFQGVFWLTRVIPGWQADVHVVLWDDTIRGQHKAALAFMQDLAFRLRLKRINAQIPDHMEAALKYATRVGFQQEGVIHYGDFYDGTLRDIYVYGLFGSILREA